MSRVAFHSIVEYNVIDGNPSTRILCFTVAFLTRATMI